MNRPVPCWTVSRTPRVVGATAIILVNRFQKNPIPDTGSKKLSNNESQQIEHIKQFYTEIKQTYFCQILMRNFEI